MNSMMKADYKMKIMKFSQEGPRFSGAKINKYISNNELTGTSSHNDGHRRCTETIDIPGFAFLKYICRLTLPAGSRLNCNSNIRRPYTHTRVVSFDDTNGIDIIIMNNNNVMI